MDREELVKECRSGWLAVESDFNARLVKPELLKYALQVMGRNPSEGAIERYWAQAGGSLSYEQFCLVMKREKKTSMNDLMQAFRRIDSNGDGFITAQELQRKLTKRGEKMTISEVQAIIAEADLNGDGKLDYSEFCLILSNTSTECIHANYQKPSQSLESKQQFREHRSPQSCTTRKKLDRHDQRREEIRMHLYSSESSSAPNGSIQSGVNEVQSSLEVFLKPDEPDSVQDARRAKIQPSKLPLAAEAKKDAVLHDILPVSLPFLQPHPSGSVESTDSNAGNPTERSCGEGIRSSRQTDHLQVEQLSDSAGNSSEHKEQEPLRSKEEEEREISPLSMPNGGKGNEGQESMASGEEEGQGPPSNGGKGEERQSNGCKREEGQTQPPNVGKEEDQGAPPKSGSASLTEEGDTQGSRKAAQSEGNEGSRARREAGGDSLSHPLLEEVAPSSVVALPPRKPKNVESWNSITGKGCFYLELSEEGEESEIKSHRYNFTLPAPTNVWVEMGVASPGFQEAEALLFIFRTNEEEEITDLITYTQHRVDDRWICRMDLDAGTYALIPFTSGCHLKPLEDTCPTHVALTSSKDGVAVLTSECFKVLEEIFHRVDLDNNGYISRTEFDFFQEVTTGEMCDDEAWNIILTNFDVTEEEEITLKGFLALHEMAAADEEGGEEELWQVVRGMGYDKQLILNQACPFSFEVLTEDHEGEIEIIDLLPFSPVANAAFCELALERGVAGPVKGGEEEEVAIHTFTTPHMTVLVVENKTVKRMYVQLDCSRSVNCINSRESAVHVVEVAASSSAIGYYFQPANASEPHSVYCTASKILA